MLNDFVVSTPKISNKLVTEYIKNIEVAYKESNGANGALGGLNQGNGQKDTQSTGNAAPGEQNGNDNHIPIIPSADIKDHIKTHIEQMPKIYGPKAYALAAPVIRDEPDIPDNSTN